MRPRFSNNNRGGFNRRYRSPQNGEEIMRAIKAAQFNAPETNIAEEESYIPKNNFSDFPISPKILENILAKNYTKPTPIQDQCIPLILEGRDLIGMANTGTGKTAAFLIPLINKVHLDNNQRIFILTPTRELAFQIQEELKSFTRGLNIKSVLCIGGASMHRQRIELRLNPNFVIGTPGRVKDLVGERALNLSQFNNVVLDETDRMVDIGFINDIKYLVALLPKDRQSLFFSATISPKVQEVLRAFVQNPVTVSVKQRETRINISQEIVEILNPAEKIDKLHDLLIKTEFSKVLIFGRTKWGVQKLTDELVKRGFKAGAIHGNKSQGHRTRVLQEFKSDQINILLATDVASRGLDIPNISHVINYDLPDTYDDYVHRIGRTGRANNKGIALTFSR